MVLARAASPTAVQPGPVVTILGAQTDRRLLLSAEAAPSAAELRLQRTDAGNEALTFRIEGWLAGPDDRIVQLRLAADTKKPPC